jgi:hypothetical protein
MLLLWSLNQLFDFITVDLGKSHRIAGFTYLPRQDGNSYGTVENYRFETSADGANWTINIVSGTFANIQNNPSLQEVSFAPTVSGKCQRGRGQAVLAGHENKWTTNLTFYKTRSYNPKIIPDEPTNHQINRTLVICFGHCFRRTRRDHQQQCHQQQCSE